MFGQSLIARVARRVFDVAFSLVFLLAALPVFFVIAAVIYIDTGRPIFFAHRRLGLGGRPFFMYKFRKFHKECSANGSQLTLSEDARFTRVGRLLAAYKLDELPQFWNILIGDMSLVGPRPESLFYRDCFVGGFERVLNFKPGLFGPGQVEFRNESALYPKSSDFDMYYRTVIFPAKARIDLAYYPRRTIMLDLIWIARSVVATLNMNSGLEPDLGAQTRSPGSSENISTAPSQDR